MLRTAMRVLLNSSSMEEWVASVKLATLQPQKWLDYVIFLAAIRIPHANYRRSTSWTKAQVGPQQERSSAPASNWKCVVSSCRVVSMSCRVVVVVTVLLTYSVPSTERLLNAKHFSRLPPKSVARQEALW